MKVIIIIINCLKVYSFSVRTELFFKCSLTFTSVLQTYFLSLLGLRFFAAIKDGTFMVYSGNSNDAFDVQGQFRKAYSFHHQGNYRTEWYFFFEIVQPARAVSVK